MIYDDILCKAIDNCMEHRGICVELPKDYDKTFIDIQEEGKKDNIRVSIKGRYMDSYMFLYTFYKMLKNGEIDIEFKEHSDVKSLLYLEKLSGSDVFADTNEPEGNHD